MGLDFKTRLLILDILVRMDIITRAGRVQAIYNMHVK